MLYNAKHLIDWKKLPEEIDDTSHTKKTVESVKQGLGIAMAQHVKLSADYDPNKDTTTIKAKMLVVDGAEWKDIKEELMTLAYASKIQTRRRITEIVEWLEEGKPITIHPPIK